MNVKVPARERFIQRPTAVSMLHASADTLQHDGSCSDREHSRLLIDAVEDYTCSHVPKQVGLSLYKMVPGVAGARARTSL